MKNRLYLCSDELEIKTDVVSCVPTGTDGYAVHLAATPFHPKGGGQPSDIGWIGETAVTQVLLQQEDVLHVVAEPVPIGPVKVRVNGHVRRLHAHLHSAGHVIGYVGERFGWLPTKAHHWPGEARVVFRAGPTPHDMDAIVVQALCDQLIESDLPRWITQRDDGYRAVGFGDKPPYACGGTHVRSLGELKGIQILSVHLKKGNLSVCYDVVK
jgi:Ser-tRNA(Ala) deacylase AlaX